MYHKEVDNGTTTRIYDTGYISQRGNNREPCFYAEDDYSRYRDDLIEALKSQTTQ